MGREEKMSITFNLVSEHTDYVRDPDDVPTHRVLTAEGLTHQIIVHK